MEMHFFCASCLAQVFLKAHISPQFDDDDYDCNKNIFTCQGLGKTDPVSAPCASQEVQRLHHFCLESS